MFDAHQQENQVLWMFMEYCEFGDLNEFYQKEELTQDELLNLMLQIALGVEYLHDKNTIHRDIKPANILVAQKSPLLAKLADFDVSKFLEENYDTSGMSSNVGTPAFKAVEFFLRNAQREISYHRNVDTFAAALTFLAILQADLETKKLAPQIEIHQDRDVSGFIGQVIAARIRYDEKELDVVKVNVPERKEKTASPFNVEIETELRKLIQKMMCAHPQDRLSAAVVVQNLKAIKHKAQSSSKHQQQLESNQYPDSSQSVGATNEELQGSHHPNVPEAKQPMPALESSLAPPMQTELQMVSSNQTHAAVTAPMSKVDLPPDAVQPITIPQAMQLNPGQQNKISDVKLNKAHKWLSNLHDVTMCVNSRDQVVLRGQPLQSSPSSIIRVVEKKTGDDLVKITSECLHMSRPIIEHPVDPDHVLEACYECGVIRRYNMNTAERKTVHKGCKLWCACKGPEGSVFFISCEGEVLQLKWSEEREELQLVHKIQTDVKNAREMCYIEQYDILIITSGSGIKAVEASGRAVWEIKKRVEGKELDPRGLCSDADGRVYVADGRNGRILVLAARTGQSLQVLLEGEVRGWVRDVRYMNNPPQISVKHGNKLGYIIIFDIITSHN